MKGFEDTLERVLAILGKGTVKEWTEEQIDELHPLNWHATYEEANENEDKRDEIRKLLNELYK